MVRSIAISLAFLAVCTVVAAQCSGQCKPGKGAKIECKAYKHICKVVKCSLPHTHKKGKACVKFTPTPPPAVCTGRCLKKKAAKAECKHAPHCVLKPCHPHHKVFKCEKFDTTTKPPTTTPPPPIKCPACPFGEFQHPDPTFCACVNRACDACPDGTVCRRTVHGSPQPTAGVLFGQFFCVTCECGYCDAQGDACCTMKGANCIQSDEAIVGQCMYGDFDILNNGIAGNPFDRNVCTPGEKLSLNNANKLIKSCGCIPSADHKCIPPKRDPAQLTNCVVPRL